MKHCLVHNRTFYEGDGCRDCRTADSLKCDKHPGESLFADSCSVCETGHGIPPDLRGSTHEEAADQTGRDAEHADPTPVYRTLTVRAMASEPAVECLAMLSQVMQHFDGNVSTQQRIAIADWFNAYYGRGEK